MSLQVSIPGGGEGTLEVFPGVDGIDPMRRWNGRPLSDDGPVSVEDSLQEDGWSMEASVPMRQLKGFSTSLPSVEAEIAYHDADRGGGGGTGSYRGPLLLSASVAAYRGFLEAAKLRPSDIRLDAIADFDGMPGAERVIVGGTVMGVITDRFAYVGLPVRAAKDILRAEAVDLRGDGTKSLLIELRQHGGGGSRDLLMVWGLADHANFLQILTQEVRKQLGARKMRNRWSLVPKADAARRGKSKASGGQDLLLEVGPDDVRGWTEESYLETPASDVRPILKPWDVETALRFAFEGNTALPQDAEPPAPRGKRRKKR